MATATRQDVRESMIDDYKLGRRGIHDGAGVTTPADDSQFSGPGGDRGIDNGSELLITSGTRDGDLCRVSGRPTLAAGIITCNPAPAGNLSNDDTFDILFDRLRFEDVNSAINKAVTRELFEKLELPITLVTDGDMLASGTTSWTPLNNATLAKVAASFPYARRVLSVTAGVSSRASARAISVAVEEKTSYYLEVTGAISTGDSTSTGTLVAHDVTNATDITLTESSITRFEPTILANTFTTPSGCEFVRIQLYSEQADVVTQWSNLILRRNDSREFTIQDRAEIDRLGNLFVYTTNDWGTRGANRQNIGHAPETRTAGLWVYRTYASVSGQSLWYEEFYKPVALSADTDTTSIPKEDVAAVAAAILLEPHRGEERWAAEYLDALRDAEIVKRRYRKLRSIVDRSVRTVFQPRV